MRLLRCVLFFAFGVGLGVLCAVSPAEAYTRADLTNVFGRVQGALVLGDLKLFVLHLKQLEIVYLSMQNTLSSEEKDQFQLWLYRFQFKRYQLQGALPPIRDVGSFEDAAAVGNYITQFVAATTTLQKALLFLQRYNKLYNTLALKQDLGAQIELQASLSLERDLDTLIRQSQIYVALLRFALDHWKDRKTIKNRLQQQSDTIEILRRQQRLATIESSAIASEQQRLAKRVAAADTKFRSLQKVIDSQQASSTALIISGVVLAVLGGTALTLGVLGLPDAKNNVVFSVVSASSFKKADGSLDEQGLRSAREGAAFGLLGGGGGGILLGGIFIVVGVVMAPPAKRRAQAVLKSQGLFLKDKPAPSTSSRGARLPSLVQRSPVWLGAFH